MNKRCILVKLLQAGQVQMGLSRKPKKKDAGIMNESITILLVEDDEALSRGISFKLAKEGFTVLAAATLAEARQTFNQQQLDLVLLDVGLPDGDGFQFCREIRQMSNASIIFLTACDQEVNIVMGYDLGADDYITKPFSLMVLVSKIHAVLRRSRGMRSANRLVSREIIFNQATQQVFKNNHMLELTRSEMKLLQYFLENPQQIIRREQFLYKLWDIDGDFIEANTLPVHIRRLREKIEDNPSAPLYIKTIRGAGYIWVERVAADAY